MSSLPEALGSQQVQTHGFVQTLDDGAQVPTLPFRLGGAARYRPSCPAPTHGQDPDALLEWIDT